MELSSEIKGMIVKLLALEEEEVTETANLQDDLGVDSLGLWNLVLAINKKYGIDLLYDDLIELEDIGELIFLVESNI